MRNIMYLVYIDGQSIKPLVNSIKEAKTHAERYVKYKPSLRIECYSSPITACIWVYDYKIKDWIKTADYQDVNLCCLAAECKACL